MIERRFFLCTIFLRLFLPSPLSRVEPTVIDICTHLNNRTRTTPVNLVGLGQRPILTCSGTKYEAIRYMYNIEDPNWFTFENIHFENSSIFCTDANLKILNCSIHYTTLFLTGKDVVNISLESDTDNFDDLQWYIFDVWQ